MSQLHKKSMKKRFGSRKFPPPGGRLPPLTEIPNISLRNHDADEKELPTFRKSRSFYTGTGWDRYFDSCDDVKIEDTSDTFRVYKAGEGAGDGVLFVLLHGGGETALTWACCVAFLRQSHPILAFDYRGHGHTTTEDQTDFSIERLVSDAAALLHQIYENPPPIILVGHSLGGAVAVRLAASNKVKSIVGVCMIDIVEGTAMAALPQMPVIIAKIPQSFLSAEEAVEWSVKSNRTQSLSSARVSVPDQLKEEEGLFIWRTDLLSSEPHWKGWYLGMSNQFLSLTMPKLLISVGHDRLDKPLTVAHMQGKFQMTVIPNVGHIIQEDAPEKTAQTLHDFAERNQFGIVAAVGAIKIPRH